MPLGDSFFPGIHSNAGGGKGWEFFTSPDQTRSDDITTVFAEEYRHEFSDRVLRTDFSNNNLDKERRFDGLSKTLVPVVLTENVFMDNKEECGIILMTREGRNKIVNFYAAAIVRSRDSLF